MQSEHRTDIRDRLVVNLMILAFLAYIGIRAYLLPVYHDEAVTFIYQVASEKSFYQILTYAIPTANNHLLTSLSMKWLSSFFGISEFIFRIPSMVGYLLYAYGIYKILRLFTVKTLLRIGLLLCLSHPLLINYFSLARGYGLSTGFMIWGLYFSLRRIEKPGEPCTHPVRDAFLSSAFYAFATIANLSLLNIFAANIFLMTVWDGYRLFRPLPSPVRPVPLWNSALKKIVLPHLPWAVLLALIYTGPILKLRKLNEFYLGGRTGFWEDTVHSLIMTSIYRPVDLTRTYFPPVIAAIQIAAVVLLTAAIVLILIKIRKKDTPTFLDCFGLWTISLMGVVTCSHILAFNLFHVRYPIGRTAIYFIPLFLLLILWLWQNMTLIQKEAIRRPLCGVFAVLTLGLIGYFLSCANITEHDEKNGADIPELIEDITRLHQAGVIQSPFIEIGTRMTDMPMINYYAMKKNLGFIPFRFGAPDFLTTDYPYDCYHLYEDEKALLAKHQLKIVKYYPLSNSVLALPEKPFPFDLRNRMWVRSYQRQPNSA